MKRDTIKGDGFFHDVFVKPFKPAKKVKTLNYEEGLYAQIAKASYDRSDAPDTIEDYVKDKSFSQINSLVYTNTSTVILGIRGTNPKNPQDLLTDLSVATDTLKLSTRYREIAKRFKEIQAKYKYVGESMIPYKYIIVGHSLGASLALQLLFDNPDTITSIHLFNQGSSAADVKKGLQAKLGKAFGVKYYKNLSEEINVYRVNGDIISFASRFLNANYTQVESNSLNRHGMDNFKGPETVKMNNKPAWSSSGPIIWPEEDIVSGSAINEFKIKNNISDSNKTMKLNIDNMTLQEMLCRIRSNKKIKASMAGYSKLNQTQLREALKKYLNEGVVIKRVVKETKWSMALKEFNSGKDTFTIPKKGSADYMKVKAIMDDDKPIVIGKRAPKKKKVEPLPIVVEPVVEGNGIKRSRVRPTY